MLGRELADRELHYEMSLEAAFRGYISGIESNLKREPKSFWAFVKKRKQDKGIPQDMVYQGPFQSDALLVPEGCLFDHIHNASRCWPFIRWNQTGAAACQDRNMQMRSFAMLLPCGISLFSGVEFVCCPKHFKVECDSLENSLFLQFGEQQHYISTIWGVNRRANVVTWA
ncbi:hypothetical protein quinque_002072 [Culex quinquefasciatus]